MKVSVVIPAINEAAEIAHTVASAVTAQADEIILVDGGSTDDTMDLARDAGANVISSPPGRATQQNGGAIASTGDILLFLHADCRLPESGIRDIRRQLTQQPHCVGGWFRQRIDDPARIFRLIEAGNQLRARALKWAYGDQAMFVRRERFVAINGFPDLPLMEDLYLMKKLKRCGQLVCIDAPLIVSARRWKQRGTIQQTLRNWTMLTAVHLGVSPKRLARFYPRTTPAR